MTCTNDGKLPSGGFFKSSSEEPITSGAFRACVSRVCIPSSTPVGQKTTLGIVGPEVDCPSPVAETLAASVAEKTGDCQVTHTLSFGGSPLATYEMPSDVCYPVEIRFDAGVGLLEWYINCVLVHHETVFPAEVGGAFYETDLNHDTTSLKADSPQDAAWTIWAEDDFTQRPGPIENTMPDVHTRDFFPQPWLVGEDTASVGGFNRTPQGLVGINNGRNAAFIRAQDEGKIAAVFDQADAAAEYGILFRVWGGYDNDSYWAARYNSGTLTIGQGSAVAGSANVGTALGQHAVEVEYRGIYCWVYFDGALVIGPTKTPAGQNRGVLSEENIGPFLDNDGATVLSIRHEGPEDKYRQDWSFDDYRIEVLADHCPALYFPNSSEPQRNFGWSKILQAQHVAEADGGNYAAETKTIYETPGVKTIEVISPNMREDKALAWGSSVWTATKRGVWVKVCVTQTQDQTTFIGLDHDLRPELWSKDFYRHAGSPIAESDLPFHDWIAKSGDGISSHTSVAFGNVQFLMAVGEMGTALNPAIQTKYQGIGEPISRQFFNRGEQCEERCYWLGYKFHNTETHDPQLLENWVEDLIDPMTGGATGYDGDKDGDGFNECYGWYEVNKTTTFNSAKLRVCPQFRIHSQPTSVTVNSGTATITDLQDGTWLVEVEGDITQISITV